MSARAKPAATNLKPPHTFQRWTRLRDEIVREVVARRIFELAQGRISDKKRLLTGPCVFKRKLPAREQAKDRAEKQLRHEVSPPALPEKRPVA